MPKERANETVLLTPAEMGRADRATIDAGTPGIVLMDRAARAVASELSTRFPAARRVALLAGPGNNGGDAFAAAWHLAGAGHEVSVFALQPVSNLSGDAAIAAAGLADPPAPLSAFEPPSFDVVVDGLFGAGLSRAVEGEAARAIARLNESDVAVVAVDLPSGVSGASGQVLGSAVRADVTVTFFRLKPGHLLEPGRSLCGETIVADIGIGAAVLRDIAPKAFANGPGLWRPGVSLPTEAGHKYDRGHAVVFSGPASKTGAARLAASAALRAGAGLVTIFAPSAAILVNAAHLTAVMLRRCENASELAEHLEDPRFNAFVLGPGFGAGESARLYAEAILAAGRRLVLDADGITAFQDEADTLFGAARAAAGQAGAEPALVLTPHAGEFKRLFPDLAEDGALSKLERARLAAERSGAVLVLKGRDTVIAAPDGRAAINATGTKWLATAGTGDVLAGMVAGALAQETASFEAAAAAVWMHGKAAEAFGPGLISEDLPAMLPRVWAELTE
ncbi:NAD(P)H-hydrate dehydratase [Aurantimonas sp. VKM B-3413]|uniref:NAD(P)H-hydrate dehydratase n=1 Tax=Aurantimonas sp. VKM B-3413 TaxID=2779401 RepID=UPI001E570886|nr:NAD(P)H-hydrate dehydratase [Aurantimonas sp. VKM B-3413]MCB8838514.1 NAD(P)H-hydrate dehydratase [Aurantimonas sp. VKM B-3413]